MPLKRHHKWMIGSFSTILIIFMITISVMTYVIFMKQEVNYNLLDNKITDLRIETQTNINSISGILIYTRDSVEALGSQFGMISEEFGELKASAGEDFSGIAEDSIPSVVTIITEISQGTGFIITNQGYVVTNYHVMQNAQAATVITSDENDHTVSIIGFNSDLDIALLKISGTYDSLELGNSNSVSVGEKVIAIGNPLGLQFSVSQGIVSAIHREGPNGMEAYIQTDAALNPGNSGGPLIDSSGEVIGINNFKVNDGENLGFALESNFIKETVNDIFQDFSGEDLI